MAATAVAAPPAQAIQWSGIWQDTIGNIANFVPKLLVFLVVLFIGWLVAKAVAKVLGVVLEKVGFTRLLARAGADDAMRNAQIDPVGLITKLAYYFILLIALQLALTAFGPTNPVSAIVNDIVAWLPRAFVAIVIVVIAAAVANAVKDLMSAALGGLSYGPLLAKLVGGFIVALGIIAALNQVGIGLSVTLPVLVAVLATIGGILVVGVGGGLIGPMRSRWESWLDTIESDTKKARDTGTAKTGSHVGTAQTYPGTTTPADTTAGTGTTQMAPPTGSPSAPPRGTPPTGQY